MVREPGCCRGEGMARDALSLAHDLVHWLSPVSPYGCERLVARLSRTMGEVGNEANCATFVLAPPPLNTTASALQMFPQPSPDTWAHNGLQMVIQSTTSQHETLYIAILCPLPSHSILPPVFMLYGSLWSLARCGLTTAWIVMGGRGCFRLAAR